MDIALFILFAFIVIVNLNCHRNNNILSVKQKLDLYNSTTPIRYFGMDKKIYNLL